MLDIQVYKLYFFLGSRYLSWLPSFSVEVTHTLRPANQIHTSQLETMARQVKYFILKYYLMIDVFHLFLGSTIVSLFYYAHDN